MNEQFVEWFINKYQPRVPLHALRFTIKALEITWNAAIESVRPKKQFGCFGCSDTHPVSSCVFDKDFTGMAFCIEADELKKQGKSKVDCSYWREVDK